MKQDKLFAYYYGLAYRQNIPVSVVIELTTRCNVNCIHCYLPEHNKNGLSFDTIKKLVIELHNIGVSHILLTGGEIFTRKDILDIIKMIREFHIRVSLLSNGTLLNEEIVRELSRLYITEFSTTLFSLQEDIHDKITQKQGSLNQLLNGLKLLMKYHVRVKIKMPIIKPNSNCIDDVKEYCDKNGFDFFPSTVIFPRNDRNLKPVNLRLENDELSKVAKTIDEMNNFQTSPVHQREVPCAAIFYSFSIDCNGDVFPCNAFLYKVGNIYENTIREIWFNSEPLKQLRQIKISDLPECKDCNKKIFCERCPGMAFLETENILSCDSYAKEIAEIRACNYCKYNY